MRLERFTSTLNPRGEVWLDPAEVSVVATCNGMTVERYLLVTVHGLHVEIDDTPENRAKLLDGKRA